jgi:hypothetical protein
VSVSMWVWVCECEYVSVSMWVWVCECEYVSVSMWVWVCECESKEIYVDTQNQRTKSIHQWPILNAFFDVVESTSLTVLHTKLESRLKILMKVWNEDDIS